MTDTMLSERALLIIEEAKHVVKLDDEYGIEVSWEVTMNAETVMDKFPQIFPGVDHWPIHWKMMIFRLACGVPRALVDRGWSFPMDSNLERERLYSYLELIAMAAMPELVYTHYFVGPYIMHDAATYFILVLRLPLRTHHK